MLILFSCFNGIMYIYHEDYLGHKYILLFLPHFCWNLTLIHLASRLHSFIMRMNRLCSVLWICLLLYFLRNNLHKLLPLISFIERLFHSHKQFFIHLPFQKIYNHHIILLFLDLYFEFLFHLILKFNQDLFLQFNLIFFLFSLILSLLSLFYY